MAASNSLHKTEALWFSPEVVTLQAGTQMFRVFPSILKAQSSVFADMFTFPQPPSDGDPIVILHDEPEEVEVFLKAIFDSSFFMPPPAVPDFEHIIGILRLSHKYDVPYLRRRALEHLATIYPTSLSAYDTKKEGPLTLFRMMLPIQVAAEVGELWLLPAAYYEMCTQELSTVISENWWPHLGEKERKAFLVGHSKQTQYFPKMLSFLSTWSGDADADCDDPRECNRLRLEFASDGDLWGGMSWVLDAAKGVWPEIERSDMCEMCMDEAKALYAAARQGFWDQLPQMFGLPGWDELLEMRRVALGT